MKIVVGLLIFLASNSLILNRVHSAELEIALPELSWILEPIGAPLTQREALLHPREYAVSEGLWPLLETGEYQQAITFVEEGTPEDAEDLYSFRSAALNNIIGQIYMAVEDDAEAEGYFKAALRMMPDFVRAHQSLGLLYLKAERYLDAQEHLGRAVELGGANANLLNYIAYLNQQTNNPWGAASAYQQALMMNYDSPQSQLGLLAALTQSQQNSSALAFVEKLLSDNENESDLWLYRAQIAFQLGDQHKALTSLEMAIRLGDDSLKNIQSCAQLHQQIGSVRRAVELYKASITEGMTYGYVDQALLWLIRDEQWDYVESLLAGIKQDLSLLDDNEKSQFLVHDASFSLHNDLQDEAFAALEESTALDPGNAEAILLLADVSADRGLYIQAELLYERAGAYQSVRERALLAHARMAIDQVDYPTALNLLRDIVAQNPQRFDIRENIRILENLINTRPTL